MILTKEDILSLELELTGTCNLSCPLCAKCNPDFETFVRGNQRPLGEIISQLESYPNLEAVCLAGIMSEPTLYLDIVPLLQYLESRNLRLIEMNSNGNTHSEEWWFNLGKTLKCTQVIFTACGSTQEIHGRYRVGSDLGEVRLNAKAFMRSENPNAYIQVIRFNYNQQDIRDNIEKITEGFPKENVLLINSLPYQERFGINSDVKMVDELSKLYSGLKQKIAKRDMDINCKSRQTSFLGIDQFGSEFPCFLYRLYGPKDPFNKKGTFDYTRIECGSYSFCYECDKLCSKLLSSFGLERMG